MAYNEPQVSHPDFLLELTSPQSSVDTSTRDRYTVQQGMCYACTCVRRRTSKEVVLASKCSGIHDVCLHSILRRFHQLIVNAHLVCVCKSELIVQ